MQFTEDENSRAYLDFDTINDALDGKSNEIWIFLYLSIHLNFPLNFKNEWTNLIIVGLC